MSAESLNFRLQKALMESAMQITHLENLLQIASDFKPTTSAQLLTDLQELKKELESLQDDNK